MNKLLTIGFFSLLFIVSSCKKEEGKGGLATLKGKVIWRELYSNPVIGVKDSVVAEYPAAEERVYLQYGDNDIYDDDFRVDYKGEYKFEGLRVGSYTVYALEPCNKCADKVKAVMVNVEISDKKGTFEAPTIYINEDITGN